MSDGSDTRDPLGSDPENWLTAEQPGEVRQVDERLNAIFDSTVHECLEASREGRPFRRRVGADTNLSPKADTNLSPEAEILCSLGSGVTQLLTDLRDARRWLVAAHG
jgi:hypothetical protein